MNALTHSGNVSYLTINVLDKLRILKIEQKKNSERQLIHLSLMVFFKHNYQINGV